MADNYLEKRMADYRAGLLCPGRKRYGKAESRSVLIYGPDVESVASLAAAFRSEGWRVAFCCSDRVGGSRLAQANGCRFYPFDPADASVRDRVAADITARWGKPVSVVDLCGPDGYGGVDFVEALIEKVRATADDHKNNM